MAINRVETIDDRVQVKTVLVSVSDKSRSRAACTRPAQPHSDSPLILSTGGTFSRWKQSSVPMPGSASSGLRLHGPARDAGRACEDPRLQDLPRAALRNLQPGASEDLNRTGAVPIDMVVSNLYPFEETMRAEAPRSRTHGETSTSAGHAWCGPRRRTSTGSPCSPIPPIIPRCLAELGALGRHASCHTVPPGAERRSA